MCLRGINLGFAVIRCLVFYFLCWLPFLHFFFFFCVLIPFLIIKVIKGKVFNIRVGYGCLTFLEACGSSFPVVYLIFIVCLSCFHCVFIRLCISFGGQVKIIYTCVLKSSYAYFLALFLTLNISSFLTDKNVLSNTKPYAVSNCHFLWLISLPPFFGIRIKLYIKII